ncbi:unnamed protein product [Cunninghamella blakesleeana]
MKYTVLISSALIALASAQNPLISVTSPLAGAKYKAGQDAIISWINPTQPAISQIVLVQGPSTALQPVTTIAQNVNAADGKYVWKIPIEIANGEYAFEFGNSPDMAYTGKFFIEGGVGGTIPSSGDNSTTTTTPPPPSQNPPSVGTPATQPTSGAPATQPSTKPPTSSSSTGAKPSSTSAANQITTSNSMAVLAGAAIIIASQFF